MDSDPHSDSQIKEIYQLENIALVGVSKDCASVALGAHT
jgi:hypothetical protein